MITLPSSPSTLTDVFTVYYDGIYHFIVQGDAGSFVAVNALSFQDVSVTQQLAGAGNDGSYQFELLMAAGDVLRYKGSGGRLYGYRTEDEL